MEDKLLKLIKDQLVRHEGLHLKPYRCTAGKLTIGVGHNLDDCAITESEAYIMQINEIIKCEKQLQARIPDIYNGLDEVRKSVLLNMCIGIPQCRFASLREPCYLGIGGLLNFENTLAFIGAGDWKWAANNMLVSRWAKQVGRRAIELSELMRKGK